jgi:antitoxin component YwqK of YwqJK toxin-antitoxin module
MRHTTLIFMLLGASIGLIESCQPADTWEEKTEHYAATNIVSSKYWLKNGKKDSIMTVFDKNGVKAGELGFKNDQQVGRTVYFYPSGQLREEQFYVDGKKEGKVKIWYESGQIQMESDYHNDRINGTFKRWNPDGSLIVETIFANDSLVKVIYQQPIKPAQ